MINIISDNILNEEKIAAAKAKEAEQKRKEEIEARRRNCAEKLANMIYTAIENMQEKAFRNSRCIYLKANDIAFENEIEREEVIQAINDCLSLKFSSSGWIESGCYGLSYLKEALVRKDKDFDSWSITNFEGSNEEMTDDNRWAIYIFR